MASPVSSEDTTNSFLASVSNFPLSVNSIIKDAAMAMSNENGLIESRSFPDSSSSVISKSSSDKLSFLEDVTLLATLFFYFNNLVKSAHEQEI